MIKLIVGGKLRLKPTKEQEYLFFKFCNCARFVYNECLSYKVREYRDNGKSTSIQDCIWYIQDLKITDKYAWIQETPEAVSKQAIKDLDKAYKSFFRRGNKGFPKYKKKGKSKYSFYQRTDKFYQVDATHIKITGVKSPVKCSKTILPSKVLNTRVVFDGKYWFFTYCYEIEEDPLVDTGNIIGIDLGIKSTAITSEGVYYDNINKSKRVKSLTKRKKHLQRKLSKNIH